MLQKRAGSLLEPLFNGVLLNDGANLMFAQKFEATPFLVGSFLLLLYYTSKSLHKFWSNSIFGRKFFFLYYTAIPYREVQGHYREIPVMNTGSLQWEQGSLLWKQVFPCWELAYREFPVSCTGLGLQCTQVKVCTKFWNNSIFGRKFFFLCYTSKILKQLHFW